MEKVAKFYKVSYEQFHADMVDAFSDLHDEDEIRDMYEKIRLPKRATKGSAGYNFFTPFAFTLMPGTSIKIPTGIRAKIDDGWVLKIYPRSGLGFKYRMQLNNTVGIIDSDYFESDNEGHIMIKLTNDSKEVKSFTISTEQAFAQGIFVPFGITEDDDADGIRNGGFGSTTK